MMCMYANVKFHHNRSVQVWETELNALSKHITGYVQQSVKTRSISENDTDTAEMMLWCTFASSFFTKGCLVYGKCS